MSSTWACNMVMWYWSADALLWQLSIEGFGGKRALGFSLKSELCQKRSKFGMQFCLGALNNVLYVFLLKFASFSRYYVCKKSLYLLSRQHVTAKTVISLKIEQNIDLSQRVTLKYVDFRVKPLKFWFHVNVRPQRL